MRSVVLPRAAAYDAIEEIGTCSGPGRVEVYAFAVVGWIEIVIDPLGHIAGHIQNTKRTSTCRIAAHLTRVRDLVVEICESAIGRLVAPWIGIDGFAASRILPLSFSWADGGLPICSRRLPGSKSLQLQDNRYNLDH